MSSMSVWRSSMKSSVLMCAESMASIRETCKVILKVVLTVLIWIVSLVGVMLPLAPVWLPFIIMRKIEAWIYARFYGMERMNSDAALWMLDTPTNTSIVNGILIMDERFEVSRMQKILQKKMIDLKNDNGEPRYPLATKFIHHSRLNYYWSEDKHFDMDNHVYVWSTATLPSRDELNRQFNEISKRPFTQGNKAAAWEYILLYFFEDNVEKTCIYVRCHHSLADGVSWMYFCLNNLIDEPAVQVHAPMTTNNIYLFMKLKGMFFMPWTILKLLLLPRPQHNLHCEQVSGEKQLAWSSPISLSMLKRIKQKMHVSVNDVLVGTLSANFYRYFKDNGKDIPDNIVASCPFDTRNSLDEAETLSNKFAVVLLPFPMIGPDPVANIKDLNRRISTFKYTAENHGMRYLARFTTYTCPDLVARYMTGLISSKSSLVLSNVPGPQLPIKFDSTPVEMMSFWPPQKENIGFSTSFVSYNGKVWITFCCDTAMKTTARELVRRLPEMLNSLAEKLGVADLPT